MTASAAAADTPVAVAVVAALVRRNETLATAESLTGGLVSAQLTSVPGASACYLGGVVTYATRLKALLADVPADTLASDGPVAASTVAAMALGIARRCGADWGIATTGVAGPDPQDGHPIGQVFVGVTGPTSSRTVVRELALTGTRAEIRAASVAAVLGLLAELLATSAHEE